MDPFEITPEDVHAAKDAVITMLTNALIRSQAELAALRREGETSGGNGTDESL
jgi:hypothetical protein